MTQPPTDRARLVEAALGENLHDWIAARRRTGLAWRRIAAALTAASGIDVTDMTVSTWYPALRTLATDEANGDRVAS
jgi:hypothetical protein